MGKAQIEELRFEGVHCKAAIQHLAHGVVLLKLWGTDVGEFGSAPMQQLEMSLKAPIDLLIDAREVRGASIHVSGEWARWFSARKSCLRCISMLTGSRFIEVTADFVRRFADLQGTMRIYTEPAIFDAALANAVNEADATAAGD